MKRRITAHGVGYFDLQFAISMPEIILKNAKIQREFTLLELQGQFSDLAAEGGADLGMLDIQGMKF